MALIPSAMICLGLASVPPQGNSGESRGLQQRGGRKRETPESWGGRGGSSDHLTPLSDHRDVRAAMSQVKG